MKRKKNSATQVTLVKAEGLEPQDKGSSMYSLVFVLWLLFVMRKYRVHFC